MKTKRRKHFKYILGEVASGSLGKQLLLVTAIAVIAFFVALVVKQVALPKAMTWLDVKKTAVEMLDAQVIIDHTFNHDPQAAGGWALLIVYVLGTVFFSGLLIATVTNIISNYGSKFKSGDIVYRGLKDHIVFLGYDDMVMGMLNRMWQRGTFGRRDVVIALQQDVALFRTEVASKFPSEYRDKILYVQANLNDESDIEKKLKIHKARKVYILGGTDVESRDSTNISSFLKVCKVSENKGNMPHCFVSFKHQSSFALFQVFAGASSNNAEDMASDIGLFDRNKQYFHPFNFEEVWARKVLTSIEGEYDGFEIDTRIVDGQRKCITEIPGGYVHIVVFGMSEMGEAFAKELAFLAHYQNYIADPNARTRITIVDDHILEKMNYFTGRYSELFKYCHCSLSKYADDMRHTDFPVDAENDFLDISYEFVEANSNDRRFMQKLEEWCNDERQYLTMVFCYDNTIKNNTAGLYLPRDIYESDTPVYIHQRSRGSFDKFLAKSMYSKVVPFGMYDEPIDIDETIDAEWAKRLNHYYWSGFKPDYNETVKIDEEWNATRVADRWSSIYNVASIPIKYRSVGHPFTYGSPVPQLTEAQLDVLAHVEHNRWCVEKLMMGFKAASKEECEQVAKALQQGDKSLKKALKSRFIHPDIVPFDQLGNDEKGIPIGKYDRLLCAEYASIINYGLKQQ